MKKNSYAYDFKQKPAVSMQEATTNSLALGCIKFNPNTSSWILQLVTDPTASPYEADYIQMLEELKKRTSDGLSSVKLSDISTILASKYTVCLEFPQEEKTDVPITLSDDKYKIVETTQLGGYVLPRTFENLRTQVVSSNVVDAFMYGTINKDMATRRDVSYDFCASMKFPIVNLSGRGFDPVSRREVVEDTKEECRTVKGYISDMLKAFPPGLPFDVATASFGFSLNPQISTTVEGMYNTMMRYRAIRGEDTDPRHECVDGYYYGFPSRSHYYTSFTVQDILALGSALKTKVLEIQSVDAVITASVITSLIAQKWLIRVVDSSVYPVKRKEDEFGIFRYFEFNEMFLRWVPLKEPKPTLKEGMWTFNTTLPETVGRLITSQALPNNCVPFTSAYINPDFLDFEKSFPYASMFPTAHAHSGHVILVRAKMNKPVLLADYIRRVCIANAWKTGYVYHKKPFWPKDPFAHRFTFRTRNKILPDQIVISSDFGFDAETLIFDRTFKVTEVDDYTFVVMPPVAKHRQETLALSKLREQLARLRLDLKNQQNKKVAAEKRQQISDMTALIATTSENLVKTKAEMLKSFQPPPKQVRKKKIETKRQDPPKKVSNEDDFLSDLLTSPSSPPLVQPPTREIDESEFNTLRPPEDDLEGVKGQYENFDHGDDKISSEEEGDDDEEDVDDEDDDGDIDQGDEKFVEDNI